MPEIPSLEPGDSRPDVCLDISGHLVFCCQLSPSMAIFTLGLNPESRDLFVTTAAKEDDDDTPENYLAASNIRNDMAVLDVIMHRKEGWGKELLQETVDKIHDVWNRERTASKDNKNHHQDNHNHEDEDTTEAASLTNTGTCCYNNGTNPTTIHVHGFLARLYPKHATDADPLTLHARTIRISDEDNGSFFEADEMIIEKRKITVEKGSVPDNPEKARLFSGQKDNSRFGKFVGFLLQEFGGYEQLSQKPVLDIAGGAGALSFELAIRHEIPTIVIDTTTVKFKGQQQRHLEFRKYCYQQLSTDTEGVSPMAQNLRNRMRINEFDQLETFLESYQVLDEAELIQMGATSILSKPKSSEDDETKMPPLTEAQEKLCQILRNKECSMLLGLHPDQATDHIIDIGLALEIPWAIVPCCVFPNLFRTRQLACGKQVRSYEDICEYILQRDPSIQEATLPFRGRNRVFYWHPPTTEAEATPPTETITTD